MKLELGTAVHCRDGALGELADVIVDPKKVRVTHLVVTPHHRHSGAQLVPVEGVTVEDGEVVLPCTLAEAHDLPRVEEFAYLHPGERPPQDPDWDVGVETVLSVPNAGYSQFGQGIDLLDEPWSITYDRVPIGGAEIRKASDVIDVNGERLGSVDGILVGPAGEVTHLLLVRGHLWGRREVTIPIRDVTRFATDSVSLGLSKSEVGALP